MWVAPRNNLVNEPIDNRDCNIQTLANSRAPLGARLPDSTSYDATHSSHRPRGLAARPCSHQRGTTSASCSSPRPNERFSFGAGLLEILEKEEISGLCWHGALLLWRAEKMASVASEICPVRGVRLSCGRHAVQFKMPPQTTRRRQLQARVRLRIPIGARPEIELAPIRWTPPPTRAASSPMREAQRNQPQPVPQLVH